MIPGSRGSLGGAVVPAPLRRLFLVARRFLLPCAAVCAETPDGFIYDNNSVGVIPRAARYIFEKLQAQAVASPDIKATVVATFCEVYNEKVCVIFDIHGVVPTETWCITGTRLHRARFPLQNNAHVACYPHR